MNDQLIDVRTPLAVSEGVRVEVGRDGQLHVVLEALTLHLDRADCERLTNTLARAMVRLHKLESTPVRPGLRIVRGADEELAQPDSTAGSSGRE